MTYSSLQYSKLSLIWFFENFAAKEIYAQEKDFLSLLTWALSSLQFLIFSIENNIFAIAESLKLTQGWGRAKLSACFDKKKPGQEEWVGPCRVRKIVKERRPAKCAKKFIIF